jgi:hypothetical protein
MFTLRICYFAAICILLQAHPGFPQSSPCGVAPVIEDGPVKGEIDSKASFLKPFVGDAAFKGQVEIAKNDVFQRYQDGGNVRLKQYFLYVVCLQVMNDEKLDNITKIEQIRKAREVVFPPKSKSEQSPNADWYLHQLHIAGQLKRNARRHRHRGRHCIHGGAAEACSLARLRSGE